MTHTHQMAFEQAGPPMPPQRACSGCTWVCGEASRGEGGRPAGGAGGRGYRGLVVADDPPGVADEPIRLAAPRHLQEDIIKPERHPLHSEPHDLS